MFSSNIDQKMISNNHQELHQNPCIASPFSSTSSKVITGRPRSKGRDNPGSSKKNLQQWLRVQELHHRIKDCEEEEEKCDLYISLGDRLCDVQNYSDALCAYGQAFVYQRATQNFNSNDIGPECFAYFMQVISNVIASEAMNKMRRKMSPVSESKSGSRQSEHKNFPSQSDMKQDMDENKYYFNASAGDPCSDPLSCPFCSGVLNDPVTIPCGHTFCRQHVTSNTTNSSLCYKCKAPWRKEGLRHQLPDGQLGPVMSADDSLKTFKTNTLINNLVQKYWSDDLQVIDMRNTANKHYGQGQLAEAMQLYNKAFSKDSNNHLILGNRSLLHMKLGDAQAALADAELALALRPDWAKGYLRRGAALKVMGKHEEAFKAYFSCLVLEEGQAKPVKQELAKELCLLLKNAALKSSAVESAVVSPSSQASQFSQLACDSDSVGSAGDLAGRHSSSNSLSDIATFKLTDLPATLQQLANYLNDLSICFEAADNISDKMAPKLNAGEDWLHVHNLEFQRAYREVDTKAVDPSDYECPLCMRTLWKPTTTPCGHTFCKTCLDRVLDHKTTCPMCKSPALEAVLASGRKTEPNEFLEFAMKRYLSSEYAERLKIHEVEMQQLVGEVNETSSTTIPVFVCTMGFPSVPCPLHVFEPRYRLMIRRCMEVGTREFGMCPHVGDNQPFADYGTMLEIRDIQFFTDGRSVVDTMGGRRFKVLERSILDGYNTAKVEFLEDETVPQDALADLVKLHDETLQLTKDWLDGNSINVQKTIIDHYGKLPDIEQDYWTLPSGPTWPWWILNIFPIDPSSKIKILSMTSLKVRLENTRRILRILLAKAGNKSKCI